MVTCGDGCTPCCDFCTNAIHERFFAPSVTGVEAFVRGGPIGCGLHRDREHGDIAVDCGYCDDFHCFRVPELAGEMSMHTDYMPCSRCGNTPKVHLETRAIRWIYSFNGLAGMGGLERDPDSSPENDCVVVDCGCRTVIFRPRPTGETENHLLHRSVEEWNTMQAED